MPEIDYNVIINEALRRYGQQSARRGFHKGFLTFFRHKGTKKLDLRRTKDGIIDYLSMPSTSYNNHSFASYLIDVLEEHDDTNQNNWSQYYPLSKRYIFYTGLVYHGDDGSAIYNSNLEIKPRRSSTAIKPYFKWDNGDLGISTTKSLKIARSYASQPAAGLGGDISIVTGAVYKINYRGNGGCDIDNFIEKRRSMWASYFSFSKKEVNIIGSIKPKDIVCYWDAKGVKHENPLYDESTQNERALTQSARLTCLFDNNRKGPAH